jgi:hypothetical protein
MTKDGPCCPGPGNVSFLPQNIVHGGDMFFSKSLM